MNILVTGGAGYVGSVVARHLERAGHAVVVLDDFSSGHREACRGIDLVEGDFGDAALLQREIGGRRVDTIVHMAASCLVGESMQQPALYYRNNLSRSLAMLEVAVSRGVNRLLFSSSAAVYGEPVRTPIQEDHAMLPTNPYGETKLAFERALRWHAEAHGLAVVSLRYFNAAGATTDGLLGEDHHPESHLVPIVLRAALEGGSVPIFGTDYETRDGTAVRDYIHVEDLAEAHLRALDVPSRGESLAFNLGNGAGYSVREVLQAARAICGRPIADRPAPRRPGYPATLVASAEEARRRLGWTPQRPALEAILETAWRFMREHPRGYAS